MKRIVKKVLAGILAAGLCFGTVGCNGSLAQQDSLVYLDYGTGINDDGNYNTKLYGINIKEPQGGDPDIIYVSEEEDPVNGGYYYMYSAESACRGVSKGAYRVLAVSATVPETYINGNSAAQWRGFA